jgi:LmbE family N-acetylglucosaminyl deacetylase
MPGNRTLAVVVAHPDNDAYGVAGSVALHGAEADFRFVLIHATAGEAGDSAISAAVYERWNRQRARVGRSTFDPTRM